MRVQGNTLLGSSANRIKERTALLALPFSSAFQLCLREGRNSTWNAGESCDAALQEAAAG